MVAAVVAGVGITLAFTQPFARALDRVIDETVRVAVRSVDLRLRLGGVPACRVAMWSERLRAPRAQQVPVDAAMGVGVHVASVAADDLPRHAQSSIAGRPIDGAVAHLERHGVDVAEGPVPRQGARGEGTSVYFYDPVRSLLELISYGWQSPEAGRRCRGAGDVRGSPSPRA